MGAEAEEEDSTSDDEDPLALTPGWPEKSKPAISAVSSSNQTDLQPGDASTAEDDHDRIQKIWSELEEAEKLSTTMRSGAETSEESALKRRRRNDQASELPAGTTMPPPEESQETAMAIPCAGPDGPRLPPSEAVMEAFAVLGM